MNIVIVNCFDTYEQRVDLIHDILKSEGHCVKVLTSDFRHFKKKKRIDYKNDFYFFPTTSYKKNISFRRMISHVKLSKSIFYYLKKQSEQIDILWVLIPPNIFAKEAAKYKRNHKETKLIFDIIDLWPETMPIGISKKLFPFKIWRNLRNHSICYSDTVVTECGLFQEILRKDLKGIRVVTMYLAHKCEKYYPIIHLPTDRISLCYLGSINNIISIEAISSIVRICSNIKLTELHIIGDGERKSELITAIESDGAVVFDHGVIYDRDEKQLIFDSCHYGLNIMKESVCVGLTMKSIDYFEFGLPIINNIKGDTWNIIESYDCGINFSLEKPCDIKAILNNCSANNRIHSRMFYDENLTEFVFRKRLLEVVNSMF